MILKVPGHSLFIFALPAIYIYLIFNGFPLYSFVLPTAYICSVFLYLKFCFNKSFFRNLCVISCAPKCIVLPLISGFVGDYVSRSYLEFTDSQLLIASFVASLEIITLIIIFFLKKSKQNFVFKDSPLGIKKFQKFPLSNMIILIVLSISIIFSSPQLASSVFIPLANTSATIPAIGNILVIVLITLKYDFVAKLANYYTCFLSASAKSFAQKFLHTIIFCGLILIASLISYGTNRTDVGIFLFSAVVFMSNDLHIKSKKALSFYRNLVIFTLVSFFIALATYLSNVREVADVGASFALSSNAFVYTFLDTINTYTSGLFNIHLALQTFTDANFQQWHSVLWTDYTSSIVVANKILPFQGMESFNDLFNFVVWNGRDIKTQIAPFIVQSIFHFGPFFFVAYVFFVWLGDRLYLIYSKLPAKYSSIKFVLLLTVARLSLFTWTNTLSVLNDISINFSSIILLLFLITCKKNSLHAKSSS